jgi:hypothetical protein
VTMFLLRKSSGISLPYLQMILKLNSFMASSNLFIVLVWILPKATNGCTLPFSSICVPRKSSLLHLIGVLSSMGIFSMLHMSMEMQ